MVDMVRRIYGKDSLGFDPELKEREFSVMRDKTWWRKVAWEDQSLRWRVWWYEVVVQGKLCVCVDVWYSGECGKQGWNVACSCREVSSCVSCS